MNDMRLSYCLFFLTRRLIIFFRWNCFVLYPLYQIQVHPELFTIDASYPILTSKYPKLPAMVLWFLFTLDKKDRLSSMDGEDLQYIWVVETEFEMNKFKFVKVVLALHSAQFILGDRQPRVRICFCLMQFWLWPLSSGTW